MPCRSSCWWRRTISRKRRRTRLRITAPPTRPEVMNPARHRPVSSSVIAFNIRSLPRCVIPFRFTCSYSERCVRRRAFGNENELTFVVCVAKNFCENEVPQHAVEIRHAPIRTKEIFHRISGEDFSKTFRLYCAGGDSAGVSSVPAGDSVMAAGASVAAGLVISVAAGGGVVGVGLVSGVTVSVFCSHAARSAAPARMQIYFFIVRAHIALIDQSQQAQFCPCRMLL